MTSKQSPTHSTTGPERPLAGGRRLKSSRRNYARSNRPVLRRPVELAEYTSRQLEFELRKAGALASMGSVADCYDNSMAESFFATLETELFWAQPGRRFSSHREAKLAISDYIEVFYNRQRRHTSIGSIPPVTYETRHAERADLAA